MGHTYRDESNARNGKRDTRDIRAARKAKEDHRYAEELVYKVDVQRRDNREWRRGDD